jgi:hypothetical protein
VAEIELASILSPQNGNIVTIGINSKAALRRTLGFRAFRVPVRFLVTLLPRAAYRAQRGALFE